VVGTFSERIEDQSPREITLPGGQPAWQMFGLPDAALGRVPGFNAVSAVVRCRSQHLAAAGAMVVNGSTYGSFIVPVLP
ncbi:MAG TPA: hypothetical protein VFE14_05725, partial [Micromonosporaceae bacterium]|nr:hypothetical protein [Micromonosporaceae bacterium]